MVLRATLTMILLLHGFSINQRQTLRLVLDNVYDNFHTYHHQNEEKMVSVPSGDVCIPLFTI